MITRGSAGPRHLDGMRSDTCHHPSAKPRALTMNWLSVVPSSRERAFERPASNLSTRTVAAPDAANGSGN